MAKGKWAQGITPRHFTWIIEGKLAICERPGGYGENHRKVRRQEEVIWLRENGWSYIISLIPADDNLECYDELGLRWKHWPFISNADQELVLGKIYPELRKLLAQDNIKLMMHGEEVGDRMAGFLAGYIRWSGMVDVTFEAITVMEAILGRQMGPEGRSIVTTAARMADAYIDLTNQPAAATANG